MELSTLNESDAICIVGVGLTTAVGMSAPTSTAAVRAGISRSIEHPYLVDRGGEAMVVSSASFIPPELSGVERFLALALPAMQEALRPLEVGTSSPASIPLFLGLPSSRPGLSESLPSDLAAWIATVRSERTHLYPLETFASGNASGLMAFEEACRKLNHHETDFCLVGGCDSYLEAETLEWLDEQEQLKSALNTWGFVPGEAAGFCLLASRQVARERLLTVLGRVVAVATTLEEQRIKTDAICVGRGLTTALRLALQGLPPGRRVDHMLCDLNGERYRTDEFGFAMARLVRFFRDANDFWTPADCWGHIGAASGPALICQAIAFGARGYAKGPLSLIWSSSESGERSAVLLDIPIHRVGSA